MSQNKFEELRTLIGAYGLARAKRAAITFSESSDRYEKIEESENELKAATTALDEHIAKMAEDPNLHNADGQVLIRKALAQSEVNFELTTSYNGRTFNRNDVYMGDLSAFAQNLLTLAWSQK